MLLAVQWAYRPLHRNNSSVKASYTKIRSFFGTNSLVFHLFFIYKNSNAVFVHMVMSMLLHKHSELSLEGGLGTLVPRIIAQSCSLKLFLFLKSKIIIFVAFFYVKKTTHQGFFSGEGSVDRAFSRMA